MALPRFVAVPGLLALLLSALIVAPARQNVAAQDASDITVTLVPSATRAKIGDILEFKVTVENTSTEALTDISVTLGLPDALDARAVNCPFGTGDTVTSCEGDLGPGSVTEVNFYVQIGARSPNGQVTAFVSDDGFTIGTAEIPPIKIVGSPKQR